MRVDESRIWKVYLGNVLLLFGYCTASLWLKCYDVNVDMHDATIIMNHSKSKGRVDGKIGSDSSEKEEIGESWMGGFRGTVQTTFFDEFWWIQSSVRFWGQIKIQLRRSKNPLLTADKVPRNHSLVVAIDISVARRDFILIASINFKKLHRLNILRDRGSAWLRRNGPKTSLLDYFHNLISSPIFAKWIEALIEENCVKLLYSTQTGLDKILLNVVW